MKNFCRARLILIGITAMLILVACGGGGGPDNLSQKNPDPCTITPKKYGDVTIPNTYQGIFEIPQATGKLPSHVTRSMDLKDLDAWWSKAASSGCNDKEAYIRNVYVEDLNRMSQLGVQQIWIFNYGPWDDFSKSIWSIAPSDYAIPQNVVDFIVQEASKRGIKVLLSWQMNTSDKVSGWNSLETGEAMSKDTLLKIMASYKKHILEQAQHANTIGLYGLAADLGAFNPQVMRTNPEFREIYISAISDVIDEIKKVFDGKIHYGQYDSIIDERIISKIDEMINVVWLGSELPKEQISVSAFRDSVSNAISWFKQRYDSALGGNYADLPITWTIYGQSTIDFYTQNGYLEDSFCFTPCAQNSVTTDFSIQAVAIEGALEAIASQSHFRTGSVSLTNYWHTDDLNPTPVTGNTAFPNISSSIRNKPAEGIVKSWYSK